MPKRAHPHDAALRELRAFGLRYPGAKTKSPWPEHCDLVVGDKTFAFLTVEGHPLGVSVKLDASHKEALAAPFAEPTGYGLGKSGWVSARFSELEKPPVELLKRWIDESYRVRAPKKLIVQLDGKTKARAKPRVERGGKTPPKPDPAAPIRKLFELSFPRGLPPLHRFIAFLGTALDDGSDDGGVASGAGIDRRTALARCLGEARERAVLDRVPDDPLLATAAELGASAFDPNERERFSARSGCVAFDPRRRIAWHVGRDAVRNTRAHLPAFTVWPSIARAMKPRVFHPLSSTGVAAARDERAAAASALLESIERDAVMATWYLGAEVREIHLRGLLGRRIREPLAPYLDNEVADVRFFLLHSDTGLPVVLAAARAKHASTCYVGASANPSLAVALEKSMTEAYTGLAVMFMRGQPAAKAPRMPRFTSFTDHAAYYHCRSRTSLSRFLDGRIEVALDEIEPLDALPASRRLDEIVRRLARHHDAVYLARLDRHDGGLAVVRAIVPGLLPLALNEDWLPTHRRRNGKWIPTRLRTRAPHPFP